MARIIKAMVVACCAALMCVAALPAYAGELQVTASGGVDQYVYSDGSTFYQGTGVTWVYDIGELASHYYENDESIAIAGVSGEGSVRYEPVAGSADRFAITAEQPGSVTVACVETWTEDDGFGDGGWPGEGDGGVWIASAPQATGGQAALSQQAAVTQSAVHVFTIDVVSLDNTSGTLSGCVEEGSYERSKTFTFKLSGLPADTDVQLLSDSDKKGYSSVTKVGQGQVTLYVYGVGTHTMKLSACGKTVTCTAVLRTLGLKKTADTRNTGSVVTFPGHKSTVGVTLTGVKSPKVAWTTSNKKVAGVTKKGVVKAKRKGRCTLKAKVDGATLKVLVEVTSKGAYQAVQNAFADFNTKLTYSQPNRMARMSRDCSSFVSRCYWDASLGRRIAVIGDAGATQWAYNAAGQARWLNDHGRRVAWGSCAAKKLRPGDTVYYETDYAGKDASQWRYIDHAGMYVGNGRVLNTSSAGGKGTVGFRGYYAKDSSVKFIGRPCP